MVCRHALDVRHLVYLWKTHTSIKFLRAPPFLRFTSVHGLISKNEGGWMFKLEQHAANMTNRKKNWKE